MRQHILQLLNLQGLWVDGYTIEEHRLVISVRSPRRTAACPWCSHGSRRVHQTHERYLKHTQWGERSVVLKLTRRRFWCHWCGRPFSEELPGIGRRRSTVAYRDGLVDELRRQSFRYVMEKTGASSNVLYAALHGATTKPIDWATQGTGITIGIDEHSYRGRHLLTTVTNITTPRLLSVGRSDSQIELRRLLADIPINTVAEVCMDMRAGYRTVIRECLPEARIVADKFHVIAAANRVVDQVRTIIVTDRRHTKRLLLTGQERLGERQQQKLAKLFDDYQSFPTLKQSYLVKEKVRGMYEAKNRQVAAQKLDHVIMLCETGDTQYLQVFGRTLRFWREEILNHFVCYSTNAVTEGINTKIKMIKRVSFGFRNINHYIAKVMLAFTPLAIAIATLNHHTV